MRTMSMKTMQRALALAAMVLLAACVSQPVRQATLEVPTQATGLDRQRGAIVDWQLSGRVAVSNGAQGGSGRIDWQQQGGRYDISLSAPVTRKSWRLTGDASGARLDGIDGGPREAADVEGMLSAATGWDIPVRALVAWVRGIEAGEGAGARTTYASDGLPVSLEQSGWTIEYRDWHPAAADRPALPRRIDANSGNGRVRLVVDQWDVAAPVPGGEAIDDDSPVAQLASTLAGLNLADPAADMRAMVASGDERPVGVCGFACLAPGTDTPGARGDGLRIIDGTGDVVRGDSHLALKRQAHAYARAYNLALREWQRTRVPAAPDARQ